MTAQAAIAVLGTLDSKGDEHLFLKQGIESRAMKALTKNVGTKGAPAFEPDINLRPAKAADRDQAISSTITRAQSVVSSLYEQGKICGIISAGGGSGTHLASQVMKVLPLGVPKVLVSTVAAHDMSQVVGTKDMTVMHSVGDLLGVNSLTGLILDRAAGAVCAMAQASWRPSAEKRRIALTMFGFITQAAEGIKARLEQKGFEVIAFHANGTGGLAMEELAAEGRFDAILDLATHELADTLKDGYCKLIGPGRLRPLAIEKLPRLVVPGGLDCAVLEFTRQSIPTQYRDRKIFFYDFRSAVRLSRQETELLADQLASKLNKSISPVKVLIPLKGWSEADGPGAPLYDPEVSRAFIDRFKERLSPDIAVVESHHHINEPGFMEAAVAQMQKML